MTVSMYADLLEVVNVLKGTELEIMSNRPSKLHINSITPFIVLLLVYYEEGQEGLFREQKRQLSPLRKTCEVARREKSVGNSGLESSETRGDKTSMGTLK